MMWRVKRMMVVIQVSMLLGRRKDGVGAFNIDTRFPQVYRGSADSLFGYSVALWNDEDGQNSLVVGAPRGTLSTYANGILPLGNIYFCKPMGNMSEDQCYYRDDLPRKETRDYSSQAIEFDEEVFMQQGIGFGETLYSANTQRTLLVACAPRYPRKNIVKNSKQLQTRGICYLLPNARQDAIVQPALPYASPSHKFGKGKTKENNDYSSSGFAQAGFSAALSKDNSVLYLGGPTAYFSNGVALAMLKPSRKWYLRYATRDIIDKEEAPGADLDGWAIALGKFDGGQDLLAVSSPEKNNNQGLVKIYSTVSYLSQTLVVLNGDEVGSKFGFSLCVGDFDGDKMDDLAVGAPFSSVASLPRDIGKVLVYYAPASNIPHLNKTKLAGHESWGRFGYSLISPGDLNLDGFDDLVVGAPMTFEGKGSVYIYNGGVGGISSTPSQTIQASDFQNSLKMFGFSLDGGLDFDGNGYPDLVIGAPGSDKAIYLRSGPVVSLDGGIEFESSLIALDKPTCTAHLPNGVSQEVFCFKLKINLQYEAKHISHPILCRFDLKVDVKRQRVAFEKSQSHIYSKKHNVSHVDSQPESLDLIVYIKPSVRDLFLSDPIEASLTVTPVDTSKTHYPTGDSLGSKAIPSSHLLNVLSSYSKNSFSNHTQLVCSETCITRSDLVLTAKEPEPLFVGKGSMEVEATLEVRNSTAYSVVLEVMAPKVLQFLRPHSEGYLPECWLNHENDLANHVICRFTIEMLRDMKVTMGFIFSYESFPLLEHKGSHLHFKFNVYSDNEDLNPADNSQVVSVKKISKVEIDVSGFSEPESSKGWLSTSFNLKELASPSFAGYVSEQHPEKLGPYITHHFSMVNFGPAPLIQGKIVFRLPIGLVGRMPLFYMVDPIKTPSNFNCSQQPLNTLNMRLNNEYEAENVTEVSIEDVELTEETLPNLDNGNFSNLTLRGRVSRSAPRAALPYSLDSPSGSTTDGPRLSSFIAKAPTRSNGRSKTPNGKLRQIELGCDDKRVDCLDVVCDVPTLLVNDRANFELSGYLSVGSLRYFFPVSVYNIETSMTLHTTQENVYVNSKPLLRDDGPPLEENINTAQTTSSHDLDEHYFSSNSNDSTITGSAVIDDKSATPILNGSVTTRDDSTQDFTIQDPTTQYNTEAEQTTPSFTTQKIKTEELTTQDFTTQNITNQEMTNIDETSPFTTQGISSQGLTTQHVSEILTTPSVTTRDDSTQNFTTQDSTTQYNTETDQTTSSFTTQEIKTEELTTQEIKAEELTTQNITTQNITNQEITSIDETSPFTTQEISSQGLTTQHVSEILTTPSVTTRDDSTQNFTTQDSTTQYNTETDQTTPSVTTQEIKTEELITQDLTTQNMTTQEISAQELTTANSELTTQSHDLLDEETGVPSEKILTPATISRRGPKVKVSTYLTLVREEESEMTITDYLLSIGQLYLILAVMGGLMVIIIICAILYATGFFKRNRITAEQRKELEAAKRKKIDDERY